MTTDKTYLAALKATVAYHFDLNDCEPEALYASLAQAPDQARNAGDFLSEAKCPATVWHPFERFSIDGLLLNMDDLIENICESMREI